RLLYNYLIKEGVKIHEYCERPLHGKVAVVDDQWTTIGSSNLDPLSLAMNLEANVFIDDKAFNQQLYEHLIGLSHNSCKPITLEIAQRGYWWRLPIMFVTFHFLRYFPAIAGWFPARSPKLKPVKIADLEDPENHPEHEPAWKQKLPCPRDPPMNKPKESTEKKSTWLTWGKRLLTLAFFIVVPALLFMLIKNLEWQEVKEALLAYKPTTLIMGA